MSPQVHHSQVAHYERVELEGKIIRLPEPAVIPTQDLVVRKNLLHRVMAAWLPLDGLPPLNFRLFGPPGGGKNALVYLSALTLGKPLYIINGHQELGPEDIALSATMTSQHKIEYVASALFAAMYRGAICFFDEIGKAPIGALDPLASVLDDRRSLTSVLAGIHLQAHPDFLFCCALNQNEEEGLGLPGFIDERTRPAIKVDFPPPAVLEDILRKHLRQAPNAWFKVFMAHFADGVSPRSAIKIMNYAYRLALRDGNTKPRAQQIRAYLRQAAAEVRESR